MAALRARRVADDRIRVRRTVARRDGMRCEVLDEHGAGKWLLNFCSNDYLGLSQQFAVTGALQDMAAREGAGWRRPGVGALPETDGIVPLSAATPPDRTERSVAGR